MRNKTSVVGRTCRHFTTKNLRHRAEAAQSGPPEWYRLGSDDIEEIDNVSDE